MPNQVLLGDCLEVLRTLPDESVDCIVTDPPYGLGTRDPTLDEIIAYLTGAELDTGGDFMGRDWSIPPVAVWRECYRVLKPGGHLLSFGGTRTFHFIAMGIQVAGFQSRDTVATQFGVMTLEWLYGQGFPKSLNITKAMVKAGITPEVAQQWQGWGTALKPSWEPILVFRKPIEEATVAAQVLATGTGAINIDALRIGTDSDDPNHRPGVTETVAESTSMFTGIGGQRRGALPSGRWPANVLLVHSEGCKIVGTKKVPAPVINRFDDGMKPFGNGAGHQYTSVQTGDADGMEEIPVYACVEGCSIRLLDEQSGELTSGSVRDGYRKNSSSQPSKGGYAGGLKDIPLTGFGDTGGASRFFGQIQPEAPFFYTGKVSKAERHGGGVDDNDHPTMKPLALMQWLVKLVAPQGAVVLDPYCGTGTTCVAAVDSDCQYIGIERDPEFHAVATKRLEGLKDQLEARADERREREVFNAMLEFEDE